MTEDGGPAFPRNQAHGDPNGVGGEIWLDQRGMLQNGMSLRDWFAGQALVGINASNAGQDPNIIARAAYRIADAMLTAREKE